MDVRYSILGPLAVEGPDGPIRLGGPRQRSFLAVLLLRANQVVSIDRLAEQLYGEAAPVTAVTQVHRQVSELRRLLGTDAIETTPPGYRLRLAPGQLDLERFERLTEEAAARLPHGDAARAAALLRDALGLWRGEPLADLTFEPFAAPAIARLQELRLAATEARIDADLALGRSTDLIGELDALVAEHPLRERLHSQRILALYRAGRQREALDAYRELRRALVDAFGIEPTPPLRELERSILRHDPSLDVVAAVAAPPVRVRSILVVADDAAALDALLEIPSRLPRRRLRGSWSSCSSSPTRTRCPQPPPRSRCGAAGCRRRPALSRSRRPTGQRTCCGWRRRTRSTSCCSARPTRWTASRCRRCSSICCRARRPTSRSSPRRERDRRAVESPCRSPAATTTGRRSRRRRWLAQATGEELRLVGARTADGTGRRDASLLLADASLAIQRLVGVDAAPRLVEPGVDRLIEALDGSALVAIGLPPRWQAEGLGGVRRELVGRLSAPLLLVHRGLRPGGLAPAAAATRFSWSAGS